MADKPVFHICENSPEEVAYKLMQSVAALEDKVLFQATDGQKARMADRHWILNTYAECLEAVKGNRPKNA